MPKNLNERSPELIWWEVLLDGEPVELPNGYDHWNLSPDWYWSFYDVPRTWTAERVAARLELQHVNNPVPAEHAGKVITWREWVRPPAFAHELVAEHHRRRYLPITVNGKTYSGTAEEQHAVAQIVPLAVAWISKHPGNLDDRYWNGHTETFRWDDIDHNSHFLTALEFVSLHEAYVRRTYELRHRAKEHRAAGNIAHFEDDAHWPRYDLRGTTQVSS